jgi:hypothetical protein
MRFASVTIVSAVACLLGFSTSSPAAEPPKGFRDLLWGASPPVDWKKLTGRIDQVAIYVTRSKKPSPLFNVLVTKEAHLFSHGAFYSATAWSDGRDNFMKIAAALTQAYGNPTFPDGRSDILKWTWDASSAVAPVVWTEFGGL